MRRANIWAYVAICVMAMPTAIATAQSGAITDAEYSVPPGTVNQVPAGNFAILVERFTMGDGSRIEISDETPLFIIHAKKAVVGNDTMIVGRAAMVMTAKPGQDSMDNRARMDRQLSFLLRNRTSRI